MKLVIVLDVSDVDPTLVDPHEVAEDVLLDGINHAEYKTTFKCAEWGDNAHLQIHDMIDYEPNGPGSKDGEIK